MSDKQHPSESLDDLVKGVKDLGTKESESSRSATDEGSRIVSAVSDVSCKVEYKPKTAGIRGRLRKRREELAAQAKSTASEETEEKAKGDGTEKTTTTTTTGEEPKSERGGGDKLHKKMSALAEAEYKFCPSNILQTKGTSGKPIELITNYFEVTGSATFLIYQYDVNIEPTVASKFKRRKLIDLLGQSLEKNFTAFDGRVLFLTERLNEEKTFTSSVTFKDATYNVVLNLSAEFAPNTELFLRPLSILFRRIMSAAGLCQISRNYFFVREAEKITSDMTVIPGIVSSILPYESNRLYLRMDAINKVHKNTTVDVILNSCTSEEEARRKLAGRSVLTTYSSRNYRISDVDFKQNAYSTFDMDGKKITYMDYYERQYNLKISDPNTPLLCHVKPKRGPGPRECIYLIPEFCKVTGLDDAERTNFQLMREIGKNFRDPSLRLRHLLKSINRFSEDKQEILKKWNFSFQTEPLIVTGRKLCIPELEFGPLQEKGYQRNGQQCDPSDFTKEFHKVRFFNPRNIERWTIVCLSDFQRTSYVFSQNLTQLLSKFGVNIAPPNILTVNEERSNSFNSAFNNVRASEQQIITVILKYPRVYASVKSMLSTRNKAVSQIVRINTVNKATNNKTILTKIAIQIASKTDSEIWRVKLGLKRAMVIGIDCYHARGRSSVLGFIASLNDYCTRFYSKCINQNFECMEIGSHYEMCLREALKAYQSYNRMLPRMIIVYRDGVGDGQLRTISEYEITQFTNCLKRVNEQFPEESQISLLYIVVKKRGTTRLFCERSGRIENPPPGTVVDSKITHPYWYDFYLIPQKVNQGTAMPSHYNVLYNSTTLEPDDVQALSYKLCHLYYNWTGTIRVPCVCQYAHKLAFLVGSCFNGTDLPCNELCNKLYFL